jgi:hypothetical protein
MIASPIRSAVAGKSFLFDLAYSDHWHIVELPEASLQDGEFTGAD